MAGTSGWLHFKQRWKDARYPPYFSLWKKDVQGEINQPGSQNPSPTCAAVMTSQHCPLLLQLLRTNEFCLDQFLNFCSDPHLLAHQFSCSPVNQQLLSSFRGEKQESNVIMGCNYSCVAGTELLLLTAVILSAFELLYDPMTRNYSPPLEKTSHLSSSHNILQSRSEQVPDRLTVEQEAVYKAMLIILMHPHCFKTFFKPCSVSLTQPCTLDLDCRHV